MATYAATFSGKRVLVTGGARGLGRTVAEAFQARNAEVVVMDKDKKELENVAKELKIQTVEVDLCDWASTRAAVEKLGGVFHHLVNNAGVAGPGLLSDVTEQYVDKVLGVNFKSYINVAQAVTEKMPEGGTIVNVSSVFGTFAYQVAPLYSISKAAVMMLTKCQAIEYAEKKIRVNCIRPGFMPTAIFGPPEIVQWYAKVAVRGQLIKEEAKTEDMTNLVLFLSSPESRMITGEDIVIDGGQINAHYANKVVGGEKL